MIFAPVLCVWTACVEGDGLKKTKYIAFCGIFSALGIVALFLGGITRILDLSAVIIATALMLIAFEELKFYALAIYFVTGLLAFILPIDTSVAVEYLLFAIYPVFKPYIERLPKVIAFIIKVLYMSLAFVGLTLLLQFVLGSPDVWYINLIFCVGGVISFILVDVLLSRLSLYYKYKLRRQLKIDRFFK